MPAIPPLPETGYSVIAPAVVILPMFRPESSVNQRLPSGPTWMSQGNACSVGTGYSIWSNGFAGSSRTMLSPISSVNQTLPSGPVVIPVGNWPRPLGYSSTAPFGWMTATWSTFSSVNHRSPLGRAVMSQGCALGVGIDVLRHLPRRRDLSDLVREPLREPEVAVGADRDPVGVAVLRLGRELGDRPARSDAPDRRAVGFREPEIPVGPRHDRVRTAIRMREREFCDGQLRARRSGGGTGSHQGDGEPDGHEHRDDPRLQHSGLPLRSGRNLPPVGRNA